MFTNPVQSDGMFMNVKTSNKHDLHRVFRLIEIKNQMLFSRLDSSSNCANFLKE